MKTGIFEIDNQAYLIMYQYKPATPDDDAEVVLEIICNLPASEDIFQPRLLEEITEKIFEHESNITYERKTEDDYDC